YQLAGDVARLLTTGVREHEHTALVGHVITFSPGIPGGPSDTTTPICCLPTAAGPRVSQRKNSTLPDGPGRGLTVTARAPHPRSPPFRPLPHVARAHAPLRPCRPGTGPPRTVASPSAPGHRLGP